MLPSSTNHTTPPLARFQSAPVDMDAPDPRDVEAIADLNRAIRDQVDHFTGEVWPNLGDECNVILVDYLRS